MPCSCIWVMACSITARPRPRRWKSRCVPTGSKWPILFGSSSQLICVLQPGAAQPEAPRIGLRDRTEQVPLGHVLPCPEALKAKLCHQLDAQGIAVVYVDEDERPGAAVHQLCGGLDRGQQHPPLCGTAPKRRSGIDVERHAVEQVDGDSHDPVGVLPDVDQVTDGPAPAKV